MRVFAGKNAGILNSNKIADAEENCRQITGKQLLS